MQSLPVTERELRLQKLRPFKSWLVDHGAELLQTTNEWELVRFKSSAGIAIIYKKKNGFLTYTSLAREAMIAFLAGKPWTGTQKYNRRVLPVKARTVLERDGEECFYCGGEIGDSFSIEHLVSICHGGPNHVSNLFPAHIECNRKAGNRSAPEKIRLRDEMRAKHQTSGEIKE